MSETTIVAIVAALIPAIASVAAQLIISASKKRESDAAIAAHEQKQEDVIGAVTKELEEVKKKLDTHNHYAEKIGAVEKSIALIQKDIEYLRKK